MLILLLNIIGLYLFYRLVKWDMKTTNSKPKLENHAQMVKRLKFEQNRSYK